MKKKVMQLSCVHELFGKLAKSCSKGTVFSVNFMMCKFKLHNHISSIPLNFINSRLLNICYAVHI